MLLSLSCGLSNPRIHIRRFLTIIGPLCRSFGSIIIEELLAAHLGQLDSPLGRHYCYTAKVQCRRNLILLG